MTNDAAHEAINDSLFRIESKLEKVDKLLTGNGEPSTGLLVRVDRLEQNGMRHSWWTRTALGAAIGATVLSVWKIVTGGE